MMHRRFWRHKAWETRALTFDHPPRRGKYDHAGAKNPNARLSLDDVHAIRSRYAAGGTTGVALAAEYGVNNSTIYRVINGKRWGMEDLQAQR